MKKCLFPLDALVVWCPTWSTNLGRSLTQGYLWLPPYDLTEKHLAGPNFFFFFQKNTLWHSFHITVIPSGLLSFLPNYCHSFHISVIPFEFCHSFRIIQRITNSTNYSSKSFPYPEGEKNGHRRWPYMRVSYKTWKAEKQKSGFWPKSPHRLVLKVTLP